MQSCAKKGRENEVDLGKPFLQTAATHCRLQICVVAAASFLHKSQTCLCKFKHKSERENCKMTSQQSSWNICKLSFFSQGYYNRHKPNLVSLKIKKESQSRFSNSCKKSQLYIFLACRIIINLSLGDALYKPVKSAFGVDISSTIVQSS